ncbi:MAG TPA: YdjY domain-containing protein [Thermoanaerobaculia bacterium]|nr:YdjY domain-containing protein [Thermoanaerobaculia bacterium]
MRHKRHRIILFVSAALIALLIFGLRAYGNGRKSPDRSVEVHKKRGEIRFSATVQPGAMNRPFGVKGHHAIVWSGGRASTWALFESHANDHAIRKGLRALGAGAGENLSPDTWNARTDPTNPEPDKRVEGTPIDVFVTWPGLARPVPLGALIAEKGRRVPHLDFRFGGNERYQAEFRSGCVVCLYSCPGGAIGNRTKTIRDYTREGVIYTAIRENLPRAGTDVTIILKPRLEEP